MLRALSHALGKGCVKNEGASGRREPDPIFASSAFRANLTAMCLDQFFRDSEPDSRTVMLA